MKKVLIALAVVIICAAFIPEDGLPKAQAVETPSPEEVAAYIKAVQQMEPPEFVDDDDCAYYEDGLCVTWAEIDAWMAAEEEAYMKELCENSNYWQPDGLSDCPRPDWAK